MEQVLISATEIYHRMIGHLHSVDIPENKNMPLDRHGGKDRTSDHTEGFDKLKETHNMTLKIGAQKNLF